MGLDFAAFLAQLVSFLLLTLILVRFSYRPIRRK